MRFAGVCGIVVAGLLAVLFTIGCLLGRGDTSWLDVALCLLMMGVAAGWRWLGGFIEREMSMYYGVPAKASTQPIDANTGPIERGSRRWSRPL
jgi:hypothetical protein